MGDVDAALRPAGARAPPLHPGDARGLPALASPGDGGADVSRGHYAPGEALLHFKPGAFVLARDERVPLVPVLLSGTRALVVGDGPWMAPRVDIRIRVLPPVEFPAGADAVRVAATMREQFARELGRTV